MEFLRLAKRRSLLSEILYLLLNIGLAVAILGVVWAVESPLPAFLLVVLSKWRVLAVRPRYWLAHVQANMVDIIVSIGLVVLLYTAGYSTYGSAEVIQIILTIFYILWLLVLKPRTKRAYVAAQAGVALVIGTIAIYTLSFGQPSWVIVIGMFILGYATARHVLSAYSDNHLTFMSLTWGFIIAQIGWLAYHWTIAYGVPFSETLKLPQVTVIVLGISFLAERVYASYAKHGVVKGNDILLPALLSLGVIAVIIALFNGVSSGNI